MTATHRPAVPPATHRPAEEAAALWGWLAAEEAAGASHVPITAVRAHLTAAGAAPPAPRPRPDYPRGSRHSAPAAVNPVATIGGDAA